MMDFPNRYPPVVPDQMPVNRAAFLQSSTSTMQPAFNPNQRGGYGCRFRGIGPIRTQGGHVIIHPPRHPMPQRGGRGRPAYSGGYYETRFNPHRGAITSAVGDYDAEGDSDSDTPSSDSEGSSCSPPRKGDRKKRKGQEKKKRKRYKSKGEGKKRRKRRSRSSSAASGTTSLSSSLSTSDGELSSDSSVATYDDSPIYDEQRKKAGRNKKRKKGRKKEKKVPKKDSDEANSNAISGASSSHGSVHSSDSEMDIDRQLKPIGGYIKDRAEMVRQMFHAMDEAQLKNILPKCLKKLPRDELMRLCTDELEIVSKKRIRHLLTGKEMTSSSGTEESSDTESSPLEQLEQQDEADEDALKLAALRTLGRREGGVAKQATPPLQAQADSTTSASDRNQPIGAEEEGFEPAEDETAGNNADPSASINEDVLIEENRDEISDEQEEKAVEKGEEKAHSPDLGPEPEDVLDFDYEENSPANSRPENQGDDDEVEIKEATDESDVQDRHNLENEDDTVDAEEQQETCQNVPTDDATVILDDVDAQLPPPPLAPRPLSPHSSQLIAYRLRKEITVEGGEESEIGKEYEEKLEATEVLGEEDEGEDDKTAEELEEESEGEEESSENGDEEDEYGKNEKKERERKRYVLSVGFCLESAAATEQIEVEKNETASKSVNAPISQWPPKVSEGCLRPPEIEASDDEEGDENTARGEQLFEARKLVPYEGGSQNTTAESPKLDGEQQRLLEDAAEDFLQNLDEDEEEDEAKAGGEEDEEGEGSIDFEVAPPPGMEDLWDEVTLTVNTAEEREEEEEEEDIVVPKSNTILEEQRWKQVPEEEEQEGSGRSSPEFGPENRPADYPREDSDAEEGEVDDEGQEKPRKEEEKAMLVVAENTEEQSRLDELRAKAENWKHMKAKEKEEKERENEQKETVEEEEQEQQDDGDELDYDEEDEEEEQEEEEEDEEEDARSESPMEADLNPEDEDFFGQVGLETGVVLGAPSEGMSGSPADMFASSDSEEGEKSAGENGDEESDGSLDDEVAPPGMEGGPQQLKPMVAEKLSQLAEAKEAQSDVAQGERAAKNRSSIVHFKALYKQIKAQKAAVKEKQKVYKVDAEPVAESSLSAEKEAQEQSENGNKSVKQAKEKEKANEIVGKPKTRPMTPPPGIEWDYMEDEDDDEVDDETKKKLEKAKKKEAKKKKKSQALTVEFLEQLELKKQKHAEEMKSKLEFLAKLRAKRGELGRQGKVINASLKRKKRGETEKSAPTMEKKVSSTTLEFVQQPSTSGQKTAVIKEERAEKKEKVAEKKSEVLEQKKVEEKEKAAVKNADSELFELEMRARAIKALMKRKDD